MAKYLLIAPMGVKESQLTIPDHITDYEFINTKWLKQDGPAYLVDKDYAADLLKNSFDNMKVKMEVEHGQG